MAMLVMMIVGHLEALKVDDNEDNDNDDNENVNDVCWRREMERMFEWFALAPGSLDQQFAAAFSLARSFVRLLVRCTRTRLKRL